jgi:hypothetical protein
MKQLVLILAVLVGAAAAQVAQVVPQRVLAAKAAVAEVYWPSGNPANVREVKYEAEHFLKKWKRFEVAHDIGQADIVVFVLVEPMTVYPGFWQRVAWGVAASQAGTHCSGQVQDGGAISANCYTTPAPAPLMPSTVLTGSILIYDAGDLRTWIDAHMPDNAKPQPIMVAFGEGNGSKPLLTAGKKLRKMIDEAAKRQVTARSVPEPPVSR